MSCHSQSCDSVISSSLLHSCDSAVSLRSTESSAATLDDFFECEGCTDRDEEIQRLKTELSLLRLKHNELKERETHLSNLYDEKCDELDEVYESLNVMFNNNVQIDSFTNVHSREQSNINIRSSISSSQKIEIPPFIKKRLSVSSTNTRITKETLSSIKLIHRRNNVESIMRSTVRQSISHSNESSATHCKNYVKAIRNFHRFLGFYDNDSLSEFGDDDECNKDDDGIVISALIDQYLHIQSNQFPTFINDNFKRFCRRKNDIFISISDMYEYYPSFASIFWSDVDNLLRFDKMAKIFPNCFRITIVCDDEGEYDVADKEYVDSLMNILKILNHTRHHSLQNIVIERIRCESSNVQSLARLSSTVQCIPKFHQIGWALSIEDGFDLDGMQFEHWSLEKRLKRTDAVIHKLASLQLL